MRAATGRSRLPQTSADAGWQASQVTRRCAASMSCRATHKLYLCSGFLAKLRHGRYSRSARVNRDSTSIDIDYTMGLDRRRLITDLARASSGGLVSVQTAADALGIPSHEAAVRLGRL